MSVYIPFDERGICLNCPRKRCVHEERKRVICPLIKEKRDEHHREQEKKRRKA